MELGGWSSVAEKRREIIILRIFVWKSLSDNPCAGVYTSKSEGYGQFPLVQKLFVVVKYINRQVVPANSNIGHISSFDPFEKCPNL